MSEFGPPPPQPSSRGISVFVIILAALAVCVCAIPALMVLVIIVLALLGASIGNVFSSIIEGIEATPTPGILINLLGWLL